MKSLVMSKYIRQTSLQCENMEIVYRLLQLFASGCSDRREDILHARRTFARTEQRGADKEDSQTNRYPRYWVAV